MYFFVLFYVMDIQSAWQKTRDRFSPFFSDGDLPQQLRDRRLQILHGVDKKHNDADIRFIAYAAEEVGQIELDNLSVYRWARQQSMGLVCYAMLLDWARQSDVPLLTMRCGSSLGAYVWTLCGAEPDFENYPEVRGQITNNIQKRLDPLKPVLDSKLYRQLHDLSQMRNSSDLLKIAQCKANLLDEDGCLDNADQIPAERMQILNGHPGFYESNIPVGFYLTAGLDFRAIHDVTKDQKLLRGRLKTKRPDVLERCVP